MKKLITLLLAIISVFCLMFGAIACSGDNTGDNTGIENPDEGGETPDDTPEEPSDPIETVPYEYVLENGTYAIKGIGSVTGKTLTIPSNYNGTPITKIMPNAFAYSSATELILGKNVTELGTKAFYYTEIKKVTFNDNLTKIGKECFSYSKITEANLSSKLTTIEESAFYRCYYLEKVVVPETVTVISKNCFYSSGTSTPNKELVLEGATNVVEIGDSAFASSAIKNYPFTDNIEIIRSSAFSGSKIQSLTVPTKITTINSEVFRGCGELTEITLNKGLTNISASAFKNCGKLATINFAEDGALTEIGMGAFYGCTALTTLEIPDYVKKLGISAFAKCEGLEKVVIGTGVTFIGAGCFASDYEEYVNGNSTDGNPRMLDYLELKSPENWIQSTIESAQASTFWYEPNTPEKTAQNYHNRRFFHWLKGQQVPKEPTTEK